MRYDLTIASMTWSYSRLTLFEDCPYAWIQKYIYDTPAQSKFFAQFGSFMHMILSMFFNGELAKDELAPYYLTHFVSDITERAPSGKIRDGYFDQGLRYLRRFKCDAVAERSRVTFPAGEHIKSNIVGLPAGGGEVTGSRAEHIVTFPAGGGEVTRKILMVENHLKFEFAGYPFQGYLDLLSEGTGVDPHPASGGMRSDKGVLYLTDHKSRALKPRSNRPKPTVSDRELDDYLRQLYIYAYAIWKKYGRYPDYLEFNCFRTGEWICEPFKQERLAEVELWVSKTIEKIMATDQWLPLLDFWYCKHICDVSADCEYEDLI